MYTNSITSNIQLMDSLTDVTKLDKTEPATPNLIDSMSTGLDNSFNDLLAHQLDIMSSASVLQNTNKVDTNTLGDLQAAVDEYAIATQVTSKICSSVVKSINELTHLQ